MLQQDNWRYLYAPRIAQGAAVRRPLSSRVRRRPTGGTLAPRSVLPFPGRARGHGRVENVAAAGAASRKQSQRRRATKGRRRNKQTGKRTNKVPSSLTSVGFTTARKRELVRELRGAKKERRKHGFDAVARALARAVDDASRSPRRPQSARLRYNSPLRTIHDFIMAEVGLLDGEVDEGGANMLVGNRSRNTGRCEDDDYLKRRATISTSAEARGPSRNAISAKGPYSRQRQRPQSALPLGRSPGEPRTFHISLDTSDGFKRRERPRSAFVPSAVRHGPRGSGSPSRSYTPRSPQRRGGRDVRRKQPVKARQGVEGTLEFERAEQRGQGQGRKGRRVVQLAKTTLDVENVPHVSPCRRCTPRVHTASPRSVDSKRSSPRGKSGSSFEAALHDLARRELSGGGTTSFPSRDPSSRFVIQKLARSRKADIRSLDFVKLGQLVRRARQKGD